MKKDILLKLAKIAGLSLALFLIVCWTSGIRFTVGAAAEGISFLVFTWYCCKKYHTQQISLGMIVLAVIVGRLLLELPDRIINPIDTLISLPVSLICLGSIPLGILCYQVRNKYVWIVCIILILVTSLFVPNWWFYDVWMKYWGDRY